MNALTGEVDIELSGKVYSLRFDWESLAAIEAAHGDNPNLFDCDTVASVAAIGFRRSYPELTAEKIKELSPPLIPFAQKIQQALRWSYFGEEIIPDDRDEEVKKNLSWKNILSWEHIKRLWPRG